MVISQFSMSSSTRCRVAAMGLVLMLAGCASVVSGRKMDVALNSNPPGAHVSVFNKKGQRVAAAITPAVVELKRGNGLLGPAKYTAVIEKPGYRTAKAPLRRSLNPWILGNVVVGGVPGFVIDPVTGAAWNPSPKKINFNLAALDQYNTGVYQASNEQPAMPYDAPVEQAYLEQPSMH